MSDLYMEVMPRIPDNKRARAMELIKIIEADEVSEKDIKRQEQAEKELEEMLK